LTVGVAITVQRDRRWIGSCANDHWGSIRTCVASVVHIVERHDRSGRNRCDMQEQM